MNLSLDQQFTAAGRCLLHVRWLRVPKQRRRGHQLHRTAAEQQKSETVHRYFYKYNREKGLWALLVSPGTVLRSPLPIRDLT